jgi:predicted phage-related endonuclease
MSAHELDTKVSTLREILSQIDALQAEAEAIRDSIKAEMINRGEDTLTGNGWKASWKVIDGTRFDSKALKAADPATFARFTIATRTSRFVLN